MENTLKIWPANSWGTWSESPRIIISPRWMQVRMEWCTIWNFHADYESLSHQTVLRRITWELFSGRITPTDRNQRCEARSTQTHKTAIALSGGQQGKVGEWLKPSVLKTDDPKGSGSSNLSLTATTDISSSKTNSGTGVCSQSRSIISLTYWFSFTRVLCTWKSQTTIMFSYMLLCYSCSHILGMQSRDILHTAKPHLSDCRWNTEDAQWRPPALGQQET